MSERVKIKPDFSGHLVVSPTLDDLKRDKEAMRAIRYLRKHYTVGEILAVYMVPALDKPNTSKK